MMKTYEFWVYVYEDGGASYTLGTTEQIEEQRSKGILEQGSRLKFRIQAETYEEAFAVRNVKLGWSPYVPNGSAAWCPNDCGGIYYPAGHHECPNCGVISNDAYGKALDALESEVQESEDHPVRAAIKSIESVDTPSQDIRSYVPEDPTDFVRTVGLTIGPANAYGGEQFYLTVCSPKWLTRACEKDGFIWGRHHLIVPEYNFKTIMAVITEFVERCSGESWKDIAAKLSRFASWEFEDYRES
jgi:hypothetical protein